MQVQEAVLVVDCETTGFNPPHVIVEIGALALSTGTLEVLGSFERRVKITQDQIAYMSPKAAEVNGWTAALNEQGVPLGQARAEFEIWKSGFAFLGCAAHNADFDRGHFVHDGFFPKKTKWLCTIQGLKALERRRGSRFESLRLAKLAEACGYQPKKAHAALEDAKACAAGFTWLIQQGIMPADMLIPDKDSLPF